jgi:hypothetical protein
MISLLFLGFRVFHAALNRGSSLPFIGWPIGQNGVGYCVQGGEYFGHAIKSL